MRTFDHFNARTVDEAVRLLKTHGGKARVNAGGTDLLGILKDRVLLEYPEAIVNIKTIAGLDYIIEDSQGLRIGALATLAGVANSPIIREEYKVLAEAAVAVASPQIRNMATIGGNLCQDVRCWYYRYPNQIGGRINCLRKGNGPCLAVSGDNRYHTILNGKKCFAVCPSDTAVALAALDAGLVVVGPREERTIPVKDFFEPLGNVLKPDEMVTEIRVPKPPANARQTFLKLTLRKSIDFAIVSVASVIAENAGICEEARIALGAVAPGPVRATKVEELLVGKRIDAALAAEAAEAAVAGARPLSKNGYKVQQTRVLVQRAILGEGLRS